MAAHVHDPKRMESATRGIIKATHYCPHGVPIAECEVKCDEHAIDCIDHDQFYFNQYDHCCLPSRQLIIFTVYNVMHGHVVVQE